MNAFGQETIGIVLNGNLADVCEKPSQLPGSILRLFDDWHILSIDAIRQRIATLIDLCAELPKATGLTRTLKNLQYETDDKDRMIVTIYNIILAASGCGLLRGFGYAKVEKGGATGSRTVKHFFGDAERVSVILPKYEPKN